MRQADIPARIGDSLAARPRRRFGVPLSRILLAGWLRKGHLKRAGSSTPGRPSVV